LWRWQKNHIEQSWACSHLTSAMVLLHKRILASLAVLVVGCAQVFGMQRGFVCDHQGTMIETAAEHCHHEAEAGMSGFVSCSEDSHKDDSEHEDAEHHAPLTVDLQAGTAGLTAVSIPVFVAVLVAEKPVHEWVLIQSLTENEMMKMPLDTGGESPPPAALQVARCMVILV
jgi:cytochrome b